MTGWLDWLRPRDGQESASVVNEDAFEALRRSIAAEFSTYRSFHVVGPARSGTTALIAALGLATNARTFSEPLPRIGRQVRQWRLGEAVDPVAVIWGNRIGRMREVIGEGRIYGEKDQQVYCWLPHFFELFKSRFVLSHRDGRESVPSLWDLHHKIHGNLYREVEDASRLSPQASERASRLPLVAQDEVDAMRSRPTADEPVFVPWGSMTRFEMISWYWADYLLVAQRDLYKLPGSAWRTVRFGGSESLDWIQELFGFLELEGFEEDVVGGLLASKPGSFTEQSTNEQARHEHWSDWDAEKTEQFDRYAASAMVQFGYYGIDRLPPVGGANPDPRAPLMVPPDDVQRQIWGNLSRHPAVSVSPSESMLVIGVEDVGPSSQRPRRWNAAPLGSLPDDEFDVVIALGAIEHAPDMDQLVVELAKRARRCLVLSGSHGHFTDLTEHRYASGNGFPPVNQWCVAKSRSLLTNCLGFSHVQSFGVVSGEYRRPTISVIVATRESNA